MLSRNIQRTALATRALARAQSTSTTPTSTALTRSGTQHSSEVAPTDSTHVTPAEVVSGAPVELQHRAVRIYQPTRNTMQSGGTKGDKWRIDFDILQGSGRWENPLMGWASSADYMQGTRIQFETKEDAIGFAERQGWDYYVTPQAAKRIPPKNYSENYLYSPNKLRILRTK